MKNKSKSKSPIKNTQNKNASPLKSGSTRTLSPNKSMLRYPTSIHESQNKGDKGAKLKLSKSREKLTQDLNTYTLLIRSRNPIRCIEHNTNISIYCETEQKLLCANCIYGRNQHKFHRVTPVDKSLDKIQRDVDTMNRLIQRELETMSRVQYNLTDCLMQQENDAHDILTDLAHMYEQSHRILQQGFINAKNVIVTHLQQLRRQYQQLMLQLKMQKDNYSLSGIAKGLNKEYFNNEELLLYEHSICSAITAQRRFEEKEWILSKREVMNLGAIEKRKVNSVLETILSNFGKK